MTETATPLYIVTGAAGFIGARMVESLHWAGHRVLSVDRLDHFRTRSEHARIDYERTGSSCIDREVFLDWLEMNPAGRSLAPRAIIHLGACADTTQTDEVFLERVNVEYSRRLWRWATEHRVPMIYASSAATYGLGDGPGGFDDHPSYLASLVPLNAYGRSKHRFDLWVQEQLAAGAAPPTWMGLKFFNVYGFGERHKRSMASVALHAFDQIREHGRARLFESHRTGIAHGEQKRDFVFVEDVLRVIHWGLGQSQLSGIYNLGTGQARTFGDLVRAVFGSLGKREQIDFVPTPEHLRAKYQYFTEARLDRLRAAGYTSEFRSLEQGVSAYVEQLRADAGSRDAATPPSRG